MALKLRRNGRAGPPAPCRLSECMALIGGAWAPNVIWYLAPGPRRFGELRVDLVTISAKVLTRRLRELEARGLVRRSLQPTSPPSVEYALTAAGQELIPALETIVAVGHRLKGAS